MVAGEAPVRIGMAAAVQAEGLALRVITVQPRPDHAGERVRHDLAIWNY